MTDAQTWTVLPHSPIEKLDSHLWRVEGTLPRGPLKRVMTLAKNAKGGLVIHNGICMDEAEMAEIEAWGEPETLIVPNGFHRIDAKRFKNRYPNIHVYCPRGARARVAEVVAVDGTYDDFPHDDRVRMETLEGTKAAEGAMIVKGDSGTTLVLNDAVFNMPHVPGFMGFMLKSVTASSGGPKVSRIARLALIKDKSALRTHLERLADTPNLVRIIVSHHETIVNNPKEVLRGVAATI